MFTKQQVLKLNPITLCLLGTLALPSFASTEAPTQSPSASNESEVERVTVIGQRQAYRGDFSVLETPQSETIITEDVLINAGALDLSEALDLSASVARQNNFGGLWNSFAVRGFVGDENLPSNYLVNGFNAGRGFGGARDLSGIESVEVLKGPRAALFGRGEPGGTVNLVTKRPTFETDGSARLLLGSWSQYRLDLDYTTPVSDDVAVRFVGYYEDAESFRDTIETKRQAMSPSIAWNISDDSQLVYELEYSRQEVPFDRGVIAIDGELGLIPESRFLGEPGEGPMEADVLGHQLEFQHDFNSIWSGLLGFNYRETSLEGSATETGFGDVIDGEINRFRRTRDYDATYHVFRAELTGELELGGLEHRLIMGIDADEFENDQVFLRVRGDQFINVFNPVYGAYPLPEPGPNTDRVEIQESVGIFIQDQISITDKLDIRIGARYDDYEQSLNNRRSDTFAKQTESRLSPQFGIVYQTNETTSIYAAYGENFRPLSGTDSNGNGFDPNTSTSMEAGIKFALNNGTLVGTAAIFQVEQENLLVVDDPVAFTSAAIGEASSRGIELDISGELTDDIYLWASYAYVDAEIENEFFDANFGFEVAAGSPLLNVPEHSFSMMLVKSTVLDGQALDYGVNVYYVGSRNGFFGTDFELPSYKLGSAFVDYEVNQAISVRAEVDNILDETYYLNSFSDTWIQPGAPRNFKVSATYSF